MQSQAGSGVETEVASPRPEMHATTHLNNVPCTVSGDWASGAPSTGSTHQGHGIHQVRFYVFIKVGTWRSHGCSFSSSAAASTTQFTPGYEAPDFKPGLQEELRLLINHLYIVRDGVVRFAIGLGKHQNSPASQTMLKAPEGLHDLLHTREGRSDHNAIFFLNC
ncbi:unnamed protein product [Thelazia callipaeda]|uniref:Uncharacterized protein n=1 Tax=Thelazia callipaeda TaxID=103827 RepID=A0A0N5D2I7_THECL|nr:unnamed protein product [Thelazia callipaeda]